MRKGSANSSTRKYLLFINVFIHKYYYHFLIIVIIAITIIKYIIHQFVLLSLASAFYLINCLCPDSLLIFRFYFPICTCSPYNLNYQFVNFLSVYLCHFFFTTFRLTQFTVTNGAEFKSDW